MVFVSGYKMVKEALVNHLDSFVDRPPVPLFHEFTMALKQRKFANTHLRYFGEGLRTLEKYTEQECQFLCESIKEEQGRPFNPQATVTNAISNIISSVVFGHRFEYTDESFRRILQLDTEAVLAAGSPIAQLYDVFPGLMKHLPGPHHTVHKNYLAIIDF
ncbi:hypothetical protein WMY93_024398 [Mugilogobius chulae]|uniref:Uncharacterized protein n=1 Tax=Mugilogobius chulae TaxID=88201 RepID=A0AAW0N2X3_9GOBI